MDTCTFTNVPFSSDSTPNSSTNFENSEVEVALKTLERRRNFAMATAFSFGLFFNTLALLVLLRSKSLRSKTTGRLLAALAVADTTYLLGRTQFPSQIISVHVVCILSELHVNVHCMCKHFYASRTCTCTLRISGDVLRWFRNLGIKILFGDSIFSCTIPHFILLLGYLSSPWITVLISFERYLAVAQPLKVAQVFTKTRTNIAVCCIFIVSACSSIFAFFTLDAKKTLSVTNCNPTNHHFTYLWVFTRGFAFIIPAVFLITCLWLIIKQLRRSSRTRVSLRCNRSSSVEFQLTNMLIFVAVTFIVLRLPMAVLHTVYMYWVWSDGSFIDYHRDWFWYRFNVALSVSVVCDSCNFAVNFFLYCMSGSQFRKSLRKFFSCCKKNTEIGA